jgi:hypothetical protein
LQDITGVVAGFETHVAQSGGNCPRRPCMPHENRMPITPFHFGPGLALHAAAPRRVSFLAFCAANVLMDTEPLYFMLTHQYPLHRFFHTYAGAVLVALLTVACFSPLSRMSVRWKALSWRAIATGAFLGTLSHVALDSVMHADMSPFAPWREGNPMLHLIPLGALHWLCLAGGVAGLAGVGIRTLLDESTDTQKGH